MVKNAPPWTTSKSTPRPNELARTKPTLPKRISLLAPPSCGGMTITNPGLVFADFDVVVDDDGEDHKDPRGEDAHPRNGFRNQARQNRPSTSED